ncbi:MAG: L,D-transpeptidase family protein [Hyphomicrobiales bacterium]|nr:L,D-transpeptidase family protein [Hyphomicrobiales bacterium]MCP5372464.1 L,D-transpeptidase family protein [Hyphomicrobiales bacterium]
MVILCAATPVRAGPAEAAPAPVAKADRVLVLKGARKLMLLSHGRTLRAYRVALGRTPEGHKQHQGDGRTPEGSYRLDWRNPDSRYHRSIHISYPAPEDRARARRLGVSPGGDIMIHGLPNGRGWIGAAHAGYDWTDGCIAVTNAEMDEIWALVDNGTPIEIRP